MSLRCMVWSFGIVAGIGVVGIEVVGMGFDIVGRGSSFGNRFGCRRVGIGMMILVGFCVILVSILLIFLCIRMGLFILVGML